MSDISTPRRNLLLPALAGTVHAGELDPARRMVTPPDRIAWEARPNSFIRRVSHTPHHGGVGTSGREPAVIAICGIGPAGMRTIDPHRPGRRKV